MEMENAENTMPFICSPIPILTFVSLARPRAHPLTLTVLHKYLYALYVISRIRLCICNNPANVTAVLLLRFRCILSRVRRSKENTEIGNE